MDKMRLRVRAAILLFAICLCASGHAAEAEPEPYHDHEFPLWMSDVRRAEIITLGSLPFTMLGVTFAYGLFQYVTGTTSSFPNPLDKSGSYGLEDIKKIAGISLGVSLTLGLTDCVINKVLRRNSTRRLQRIQSSREHITVIPVTREEAEALEGADGSSDGNGTE